MRERTSASQTCGSTPFILAETRGYTWPRRAVRHDRIHKTAMTFSRGLCLAALFRRRCWRERGLAETQHLIGRIASKQDCKTVRQEAAYSGEEWAALFSRTSQGVVLSLIHISEPTRRTPISY